MSTRKPHKSKLILIITAVMLLGAVPARANAGKYCGSVAFAPNTEYTDGYIRAIRLDCPHAIGVAVRWTLEGRTVTPYGFACKDHVVNDGVKHADVRCARGRSVVTFSAY